jgi:hypothetical protein
MSTLSGFLRCSRWRLLLFTLVLTPALALGVVGRSDRSDAERLRLGQRFPAAGQVLPDGGCTLIAPTWALTAAHVAASLPDNARVRFGGEEVVVARVVLHPEGSAPRGRPPEVDLALLEFSSPVVHTTPVALYRKSDELGKLVHVVGYGDFGTPAKPLTRSDGRRRAVTNIVEDAGPRRLFLRFDAPPAGTPDEGIGGPGDSGGPAFIESEGKLTIAGVSSASMDGKPGQYGVTDVYTRVSAYAAWIDREMQAR